MSRKRSGSADPNPERQRGAKPVATLRNSDPHAGVRLPFGRWSTGIVGATIFLAVMAVFSPCLRNGFVDWDDPAMLLENPHYRGLGPAQLRWMFTTFHMGHYQPLSWITLAVDYLSAKAWFGDGLDPRSYHLTNIVLHAANAVLVYLLGLKLLRGAAARARDIQPRSHHGAVAMAALLMAIHPLRVESAAWVTERRDVLSSFFLLLTVLLYLRAVRLDGTMRTRSFAVVLPVYLLSLLSRAMGVTLPLVLLLLDWYPLRRVGRSGSQPNGPALRPVLLEKLPFLVPAIAAALAAPLAQHAAGATATWAQHGALARAAQACYGLVFYVWKTLAPLRLSPIYELRMPIDLLAPRYVVAAALVLLATVGVIVLRRRQPAITVALTAYAVLLAPVAGLVQSGNQEAADRYSYLPAVPLALLLGAGLRRLWQAARPAGLKHAAAGLAGVAVVTLAVLTWRQCAVWQSTATLWEYAAGVSPASSIAQNGYGWVLLRQKHYDDAAQRFRLAIQLQPTNPKAHYNLWTALREQGREGELLQAYRDSIRVYPTFVDAYFSFGNELRRQGQTDDAVAAYRAAIKLSPGHAKAHTNLAFLLAQQGQTEEALQHYDAAIRADPQSALARRGFATLLKRLGRDAEAVAQIRIAVQLDPNDATSRQRLESWTAPFSAPQ
jgi:tetratricopeptide (TPR) repeat protein